MSAATRPMPPRPASSPARRVHRRPTIVAGPHGDSPGAGPRRPNHAALLAAVALANAGGVIAYLPLLSLLLPMKIEAIAGAGRIGLFSATVVCGAIVASVANIAFGWLADRAVRRGGARRRWLAGGLIATLLAYALIASVRTPAGIIVAIALYQCAVNALLSPILAIMAEETPDAMKGISGGLLALGTPAAAAVSALLVDLATLTEASRLACIGAAIALCVVPLLLVRGGDAPAIIDRPPAEAALLRRDLWFACIARLLIQIAAIVLSLYLLYYFESLVTGGAAATLAPRIGHLLTAAYILPLPVAVLVGRLSDWSGRRRPFLLCAALIAASGLLAMAVARDWPVGAAGFVVYATGSAIFLALHAGFAMQLLPDPRHVGRDLGLLNLTNTLPGLIGPALTWVLATPRDFGAVMITLAGLGLCGGLAMLGVRGRQ